MNSDRSRLAAAALAIATVVMALSGCLEDTISPKLFGDVYGEVLEREDNVAVGQTLISTNPPTSTVTTDVDGRFRLVDIPEGTYSLRAEREGFVTEVTSVTVFGDQDASVIIRLATDSASNTAPVTPVITFPADGATGLPIGFTLSWRGEDADADDVLRYDVTLYEGASAEGIRLASATTDTSLAISDLRYGATYRWQVTASDGLSAPVLGPVATFRTREVPDYRILFARAENERYDIYATDGLSGEIRLTEGPASNWRPRVNPQRTRVAFISNAGVSPQLYTVRRDGSDRRRVTRVPLAGADPLELDFCWSPDGTKLLYPGGAVLYEINPDGTGLRVYARAPAGRTFAGCDWSDQAEPAIVARLIGATPYAVTLARVDAAGNVSTLVADDPGALGCPRFSVSGNELLYSRDVSGFETIDGRQLDARVFVRDLRSGSLLGLSAEKEPGTNDLDPVYAPDGARVLLTNENNDGLSRSDLYAVGIDGEDRTLVVEDAEMGEWK